MAKLPASGFLANLNIGTKKKISKIENGKSRLEAKNYLALTPSLQTYSASAFNFSFLLRKRQNFELPAVSFWLLLSLLQMLSNGHWTNGIGKKLFVERIRSSIILLLNEYCPIYLSIFYPQVLFVMQGIIFNHF